MQTETEFEQLRARCWAADFLDGFVTGLCIGALLCGLAAWSCR